MKHQIGIITLGISNLNASKKFYMKGFGWETIHEDNETAMYQMNGFVLSTWLQKELEKDIQTSYLARGGAITLAHVVDSPDKIQICVDKLSANGGKILRRPCAPLHGGMRGYIADPDDHIWEIIYNPVWKVDKQGFVTIHPNQDSLL